MKIVNVFLIEENNRWLFLQDFKTYTCINFIPKLHNCLNINLYVKFIIKLKLKLTTNKTILTKKNTPINCSIQKNTISQH